MKRILALWIGSLLWAVGVGASSASFDWLAHLKKEHPRLLLRSADLDRIQRLRQSDPLIRRWADLLHQEADRICNQPTSQYVLPDGKRLLATSRRVLHRVYTLALIYRLDPQPKYLRRAWQELEAAARFKDWNPRHFLDTAEMSHAFAIGYDWLYDQWTPQQRKVLQTALIEKGLKPALQVYRRGGWWAKSRFNWNQVCNGGIGLGALAILDQEPALCTEILNHAVQSIRIAMGEFAPDGAWPEGPGYWNYATRYNCAFLAGLESAVGTDWNLSQMPGFAQTGWFPIYVTGPLGRTFNFADGGDGSLRAPQMFWLARKFHQPLFAWHARTYAAPAPQDLLWYVPTKTDPIRARLPLDRYFRHTEIVTMRTAWLDPKATFVGFKAGDNRFNHSHLDLGTFVLDAQGRRWAVDLGSDNYNLPQYFGRLRWTYYRLRAEGHNTLVLNPSSGPDQDPKAATQIIRFQSKPQTAFALADLTAAYAKDASRVWRGIRLDRRNQSVLVQDEVTFRKPGELWWFLHTPAQITLTSDRRTAILRQEKDQLLVKILSPASAKFQILKPQPLPTSPHPKGQRTNRGIQKLAIHLQHIDSVRLGVLLSPVEKKKSSKEKTPTLIPLENW